MEPVSIAASLVTLAGLASHLGKVSRILYRAARTKTQFAHEARMAANGLDIASECFTVAIKSLETTLAATAATGATPGDGGSGVVAYMQDRNLLSKINTSAADIKRQLDERLQWIKGMNQGIQLIKAYQWLSCHKPGMQQITEEIQFVQTNLTVLLCSARVERNNADALRTMDELFHARIKEQNEEFEGKLKMLERRLRKQRQTVRVISNVEGQEDTMDGLLNGDDFIRLSVSIRRTGRAPLATSSPLSTATSNATSNATSSRESRRSTVSSSQSMSDGRSSESLGETTPDPGPEDDEPMPHTPPPPPPPPPPPCIFQSDIGYVEFQPLERRLKIDTSSRKAVPLFHAAQDGSEHGPIVAIVAGSVPGNVVSYRTACNLGLDIHPLEQDDPVAIDFVGDGHRQILGRTHPVKIFSAAKYKMVELFFWVYEDHTPRMIVGRPFVDRRHQLWARTVGNQPEDQEAPED